MPFYKLTATNQAIVLDGGEYLAKGASVIKDYKALPARVRHYQSLCILHVENHSAPNGFFQTQEIKKPVIKDKSIPKVTKDKNIPKVEIEFTKIFLPMKDLEITYF